MKTAPLLFLLCPLSLPSHCLVLLSGLPSIQLAGYRSTIANILTHIDAFHICHFPGSASCRQSAQSCLQDHGQFIYLLTYSYRLTHFFNLYANYMCHIRRLLSPCSLFLLLCLFLHLLLPFIDMNTSGKTACDISDPPNSPHRSMWTRS